MEREKLKELEFNKRELEVLDLLVTYKKLKEITEILNMQQTTLAIYYNRLLQKFQCKERSELRETLIKNDFYTLKRTF